MQRHAIDSLVNVERRASHDSELGLLTRSSRVACCSCSHSPTYLVFRVIGSTTTASPVCSWLSKVLVLGSWHGTHRLFLGTEYRRERVAIQTPRLALLGM